MMFLNPYTPPSKMVSLYSTKESLVQTNPRLSHYYDRLEGSRTERCFDEYVDRVSALIPNDHPFLLDVACGNGYFLYRAKRKGWAVQGVETSREAAESAREKYGVEVTTADFLSYDSETRFDCVSLLDFIEHVPNPREILRKARSLLKEGGILLLATPDHFSFINSVASMAYRTSFSAFRRPLEILFVPEHILYFTDQTLRKLVEEGGFKILEVIKAGTDIDRYNTSRLFNWAAKTALLISKWLHWENRIIILAQKKEEEF